MARWPAAPWMLARASAKRMLCQRGFSRVAQSCTLRRTGTYPCSVSVRQRITANRQQRTANRQQLTTSLHPQAERTENHLLWRRY